MKNETIWIIYYCKFNIKILNLLKFLKVLVSAFLIKLRMNYIRKSSEYLIIFRKFDGNEQIINSGYKHLFTLDDWMKVFESLLSFQTKSLGSTTGLGVWSKDLTPRQSSIIYTKCTNTTLSSFGGCSPPIIKLTKSI